LEENKIYVAQSSIDLLKNSYVYDSSSFITLKSLDYSINGMTDLINYSYDEAWAHIAPASIAIKKNGNTYEVFLTQTNVGYLFASTMFSVSSFLKNEYGIDAMIISSIEMKTEMSIGEEQKINQDTISVLVIVCVGSVFGFIIYLGGLVNEKIKERRTQIKHLLYLSGSDSITYWLAFFIIDYMKLVVYSILLIIPIYYINSRGSYYFLLDMLVICASSLIFIYFISFFGTNAGSGVKFLFILLLGYILFLVFFVIFGFMLALANIQLLIYVYESFNETYNFTILDVTPVTSMLLSFGRILYGIATYDNAYINRYHPRNYLGTSCMVQAINFVLYSILLVLMESGNMTKCLSHLKKKMCISENNF
jgi:hypothetical protein